MIANHTFPTGLAGVRPCDQWIFNEDWLGQPRFVALSLKPPASAGAPGFDWIEIDEQADGMAVTRLHAYVLPLPVSRDLVDAILKVTDYAGRCGAEGGWRHNLSWHNTPMDCADDPTVRSYQEAIGAFGLVWTWRPGLEVGLSLAQAAYPIDVTDANLRALGPTTTVEHLFGEAPDPAAHSVVLLTQNDD